MKIIRWILKNIEELVAGTAGVIMITVTTANVLGRYLFNAPIVWAEELSTICFVWLTFIGAAVCYKSHSHLGMDFLINKLPFRCKRAWQQILCVFMFIFFATICFLAVKFTVQCTKTTPFFHLNYGYLYIAVALGFFSMMVHSVTFIVMSFKDPHRFNTIFVDADEDGELTGGEKA